MLPKDISKKILTIGCRYKRPRGGVAYVMYNYSRYVFPEFKCIANSGFRNKSLNIIYGFIAMIATFFRLCIDRKIKIVHIHTASYNSFRRSAIFVDLALVCGKKPILHIHGGGFKEFYATKPEWISKVLNKCATIIVLSQSWKQFFESITDNVPIHIVNNVVSAPSQDSFEKIDDSKFHLLFLGLLDRQKGIFDLLNAIADNKDTFKDRIHLHIGGNGDKGCLIKRINVLKIENIVTYEGFVSGKKKEELLQMCDAYILPSYVEGLPLSIIEAMTYGKPILTTPVGAIPEIVSHGKNGLLFNPGDEEGIANSINTLMNNKKQCLYMGECSKLVANDFLPEMVSHKLYSIYSNLIGI